MKQFVLLISVLCAFTACDEDQLSIAPDTLAIGEDQTYISVHVVVEDLAANNGGCAEGTYVHNVQDAEVSVFTQDDERFISPDALLVAYTDKNGDVSFKDLPEGRYLVKVESEFGHEKQSAKVAVGKGTKIFVRF